MLKARGYQVLVAHSGAEAISICESHKGPLGLILSDVIVPGLSGPELVTQVQGMRAGVKALFMSGYTDHAILRDGALQIGMSFIQKPFAPAALAMKVREVLDA
jgi:DNA-binding NtrC family response regulator